MRLLQSFYVIIMFLGNLGHASEQFEKNVFAINNTYVLHTV